MVVFNKKQVQKPTKDKPAKQEKKETDQRIVSLEQELQSTKQYLQTTIEELETTNEELKSSNEELQSTNEELQSTNEELETSKEELQSTNEELITVNSELQNKVDELSRANNDINNLLASTEIGTIFLDTDFCIKRFTPAVRPIFNLIPSDIDRPIKDISANVEYDNLIEDAKTVLRTLVRKEVEFKNKAGLYFSMRMAPYRTVDNKIDGIVLTFMDITEIKYAEKLGRLATVVADSNDAVTVQNLDGAILAWNKSAEAIYGYKEAEALKMNVFQMVPDEKRQEAIDMITKIKSGNEVTPFKTKRIAKDGHLLDVLLTATRLLDKSGNITAIATTERDITEIKLLKEEYESRIEELKKQFKREN